MKKSVKKAKIELGVWTDGDIEEIGAYVDVVVPDQIDYNGTSYPANVRGDGGDVDYRISEDIEVSAWCMDGYVTIGATHPSGQQLNPYSAKFTYCRTVGVEELKVNPNAVYDAIQDACASLPVDDSTVKSQDIHSMIAQIRQNNNSLTKSRIDIHKGIRSVGQSYNLDIERIADEMLKIIIDSKQPNGDYALDEYGAYDKWCDENYHIESYDEYGEPDYNYDIIDAVEDKFYDYKDKLESELMNKIYDLEYNDLVEFDGYDEVYVKSTNGNSSYEGCRIWAGPDKDDDMGGYYYASDFVRVVERSNSGKNLFNQW